MAGNTIEFKIPIIVDIDQLQPNDYNPNRMPDVEMSLLKDCISTYGFLFPILANLEGDKYVIIDGYHRYETLKRLGSKQALIIPMNLRIDERMKLTVLMNRIKGMHRVESMSELVVKLEEQGLEDSEICKSLGMEAEEFLRLKQQLGIAHAFKNHSYSNSWEVQNDNNGE